MISIFFEKIRPYTRRQWVILLGLTGIFIILNAHYFSAIWHIYSLPGYDGGSHAAVGEYYAKHIFPKTAGWIPEWFGGFPFPQLYSPLFYFVAACLYWLLPFSYIFTVKIFVTLSALLIPYLVSRIARCFGGGLLSQWFTGITALVLASTFYSSYGNDGLNLQGTFNVGLVTQTFGFVLFLVWFEQFIKSRQNNTRSYTAIFCLSLVLLSNTHIVVPTAIFIFFFFMRDALTEWRAHHSLKSTTVFYSFTALLPCLMCAFWFIPMFSYWNYLTGVNLDHSNALVLYLGRNVFNLAALLILVIVWWKKNTSAVFMSSLALFFIFITANIPGRVLLDSNIPIHTYRYFAFYSFLSLPAAGLVFEFFWQKLKPLFRIILIICCALPFIHFYYSGNDGDRYDAFYFDYKKDNVAAIVDYMKDKKERSTVEVDSEETRVPARVLHNALGTGGVATNFTVFSEIAISSIFLPIAENSFSTYRTSLPAYSPLQANGSFLDTNVEKRIDRAKALGVKYIFVRSIRMTRLLATSPRIELLQNFGTWKLFGIKEEVPMAMIAPYQPTLFFGEINFKDRSVFKYDYTTVNEALFQGNAQSRTVVYANDQRLDTSTDLGRFDSIFISSFHYKNVDIAYDRLVEYSKKHKIILVESTDPLYIRLRDLKSKNVAIVPEPTEYYWHTKNIRNRLLLSKLISSAQAKIPEKGISVQMTWKGNCMALSFSDPLNQPVLVKSSYFPSFKTTSGAPLYLATPTFMFGHFKNNESICFKVDKVIPWSYGLSLTTLGTIVYLQYRKKRTV